MASIYKTLMGIVCRIVEILFNLSLV